MLKLRCKVLVLALIAGVLQGCAVGVIMGTAALAGGAATVLINDRRSMAVQSQDSSISARLRELLSQDTTIVQAGLINVDTYNRVVLLTGEADSHNTLVRAEELARSLPEVRRVQNQVRVIGAGENSDEIRQNDFFTSAKIKATLMQQAGVSALHTQVTTDGGTAYLMGLVTREEAAEIIEVVSRVDGVQRVVPLFEYVRLVSGE